MFGAMPSVDDQFDNRLLESGPLFKYNDDPNSFVSQDRKRFLKLWIKQCGVDVDLFEGKRQFAMIHAIEKQSNGHNDCAVDTLKRLTGITLRRKKTALKVKFDAIIQSLILIRCMASDEELNLLEHARIFGLSQENLNDVRNPRSLDADTLEMKWSSYLWTQTSTYVASCWDSKPTQIPTSIEDTWTPPEVPKMAHLFKTWKESLAT